MEQFDALEVIARTRGKVDMDATPTGDCLFILWGTLTAVFFLLEFALWQVFQAQWCLWLWVGIPVIGFPVMAWLLRRDHNRTHVRTRASKVVLDYWIFVGCASGVSGFVFGFAGVYSQFTFPVIGLLTSIGAFITGEILRFRPKTIGDLISVAVSIGSFLLQGDLWAWQMLAIAAVALIALVIPGIFYMRSIRNGV